MVQCAIKFDNNPLATFYSGSIIHGKVEIILEKPMKIRGISLIISGQASVKWTEMEQHIDNSRPHNNKTRTETVYYTASESYIHTITYLCGSPNDSEITLDTGIHIYTFSCALPPQLPSSVEGCYGKIRYSTKVVFDRPWKFDKTFTTGFTVIRVSDLNNEHPSIRLPTTLQVSKTFWCWPCASKPLIIEVTIPQSGYVSGQNIPITVNLYNESGRPVQHIGISLKKMIKYHSDYPTHKYKLQKITVKKIVIGSIQNSPKEALHADLLVPAVPPTCPTSICRIIQVYYEIRIKAFVSGLHTSPSLTIPIQIGNIPIIDYTNQSHGPISAPSAPSDDIQSPTTPENSSANFGLPPPTYEEAIYLQRVNMNEDDKHPICESNYIPRYPVYHFEPSAPSSTTKS
ncbi:arrestin domain-containing protein 3-like [Condylostylus longicornis]|uniref:arrestin domain-containing protein 3-like n=1 Tax=Condylostylus longicornis TaxID=2530218 RepID=UPI00244E4030|nr:arrestin domain-containing protein 3-like [Condylostylus longicornis]